MSNSDDERRFLLGRLDSVEAVLVTFLRLLLVLLIIGVLAGTVFVIVRKPWGAGNQGEWFYFTIAVIVVLGWAGGQFIALGRRLRKRPQQADLDTENRAGIHTWKFQFGTHVGEPPRDADDQ